MNRKLQLQGTAYTFLVFLHYLRVTLVAAPHFRLMIGISAGVKPPLNRCCIDVIVGAHLNGIEDADVEQHNDSLLLTNNDMN